MKLCSACLIIICCFCLVPAAEEDEGTLLYVNEFMNNGGGARAVSLGEAMAADQGDMASGLYNPCGILGIRKMSALVSHASLFNGLLDYDFVSFLYPLDTLRSVGAYAIRSAVDEIWDTRGFETDSNGIPTFDQEKLDYVENVDYAVGLSYASVFRNRLRYGVTLKFIRRRMAHVIAYGTGLDAGVQYLFKNGIVAGLYGKNITTSVTRYDKSDYEVGLPELYAGVAYRREIEYIYGRFEVVYQFSNIFSTSGVSQGMAGGAFDLESSDPQETGLFKDPLGFFLKGNAGLEYTFRERLSLRLGTNAIYMYTAGVGIRIYRLNVDFAFRRHVDLDNSYRIALAWDFKTL
jgi:hypothetical protein